MEKIKNKKKEYYENNQEKSKEYYEKNKDVIREKMDFLRDCNLIFG